MFVKKLLNVIFIILLFSVLFVVSHAQNQQNVAVSRLFNGKGVNSPYVNSTAPPKVIKQSNKMMDAITSKRFCVKSYFETFNYFSGKEY